MTRRERYTDKVARHGCMVCGSPAAIHHVRRHGIPRDKAPIIPLCGAHHQTGGRGVAIHAGRETFEANFGSELEMVERIINIYGEMPGR